MKKYKYKKAITIHDKYGKSTRKYLYADSLDELDKKVTEIKYLDNKGIVINSENISMKDLSNMWFDLKQANNEDATKNRNRGILDNHIIPSLGHIPAKKIKAHHIDELINKQLSEGLTDTIRKTVQDIGAILDFGIENDYLYKNVAKTIKIPKFKSKERKFLNAEQRKIVEESQNKYRDLFTFIMYTGMRKGEVGALKWSDIDFEEGTIIVDESICYLKNKGKIKETKNGKKRIIPILDKTKEILERQPKESEFVFYKQDHNHLSDSAFDWYLESFLNDSGLDFTIHELRHTFGTVLYYAGVPLKEAQQMMGHASVNIMLEIYTHLDKEFEKSTSQKINNFINGVVP